MHEGQTNIRYRCEGLQAFSQCIGLNSSAPMLRWYLFMQFKGLIPYILFHSIDYIKYWISWESPNKFMKESKESHEKVMRKSLESYEKVLKSP